MKRWPWLACSCALGSWLLSSGAFGPGEGFALLRGFALEQPARLWAGHFVHFNAAHLLGDLLAFAVWAALVERESRRLLLAIVLVGPPILSLLVLWLHPGLDEYRGLSALDCALAVALMLRYGDKHRALSVTALLLFCAKCAYELVTGHAVLAPELGDGVRLLPLSHLLGAALGAACFAWFGRHGSNSFSFSRAPRLTPSTLTRTPAVPASLERCRPPGLRL